MNPHAIRDQVAVVGMGCCKLGESWDKAPQDMIVEAAYEGYENAGREEPHRQIEAVFCGAQSPSKGTAEVADALKMYDRPVSMVVNYCATGTDAFRYGVFAVACGMYDTVLVVGFDKPKDRGVSGPSVAVTGVRGLPATPAGWFSHCAARYFETYGAGREDLARIAVKNHHNGTLAPKSMLKREITIDDVLKARIISWPFGLYDCAAQSDGAAAAIITRRELAKQFRDDRRAHDLRELQAAPGEGGEAPGEGEADGGAQPQHRRRAPGVRHLHRGAAVSDVRVTPLRRRHERPPVVANNVGRLGRCRRPIHASAAMWAATASTGGGFRLSVHHCPTNATMPTSAWA